MLKHIITIIFLTFSASAYGQHISQEYIDQAFEKAAAKEGVPLTLLRAICWAESKHNPAAFSEGDGRGNNHAFGLCQVLHETAIEYGFKDKNCFKDFSNHTDENGRLVTPSRTYRNCKLFGVETNTYYAAVVLKEKLDKYDGSWIYAIAAYNTGTVRICKTGVVHRAKDGSVLWKCHRGGILNQAYVDRVLKALEEGR